MSDSQEPSMEAQEEMLRNQAAEADSQGVSIDELQTSIGENSGAAADPVKDNDEGNVADNENSDEDEDGNNPDTNTQGDSLSNPDSDEGTQNAESSNQNPEAENGTKSVSKPEDKAKEKARKEEDRRDRSWKKLEEEKAQLLRDKAEWEAAKLTNPATQPTQNNNPAQNPNALADAFDKIAKDFEEAGDFDKADEARQKASNLRTQQQQPTQQAQGSQQPANMQSNPQFKVAWNANMERAINDFPEMKDPASNFGKTVTSLLRAPDSASYFSGRPDGVYVAAQLTKMKMTALRVPSLEKEIVSLKEELKKLRQGMSLPETGAQGRGGEAKSIDSMTLEQQEAFFRKQAEMEDASGAPVI